MKQILTDLAGFIVSGYNTEVGSTALVIGQNVWAGEVPERPNSIVSVVEDGGVRFAESVIYQPIIAVVVRDVGTESGPVRDRARIIYKLLERPQSDISTIAPGILRPLSQPFDPYQDGQNRVSLVSKFRYSATTLQ